MNSNIGGKKMSPHFKFLRSLSLKKERKNANSYGVDELGINCFSPEANSKFMRP